MSGTIHLSGGVAQVQKGANAAASFPVVASGLIYSGAAYSAFPRVLALSGGGYLVSLKAGVSHEGSGDGAVLHSSEFSTWTTRATLAATEGKTASMDHWMSHTPDGRIQMLRRYWPVPNMMRVSYSSDGGATWSTPASYGNSDIAWFNFVHGGNLFSVVYSDPSGSAKLLRWMGDTTVENYATIATVTGATECGFGINGDGLAVAHLRINASGISKIYTSPAPYTTWTHRLDWNLWHGPIIRTAPDGTLWGIGRWFHSPTAEAGKAITAVIRYDGYTPRVVAYLPGMASDWGDCGYGDLVWIGAETYPRAVYYAPGGTTTAIYTAIITEP